MEDRNAPNPDYAEPKDGSQVGFGFDSKGPYLLVYRRDFSASEIIRPNPESLDPDEEEDEDED